MISDTRSAYLGGFLQGGGELRDESDAWRQWSRRHALAGLDNALLEAVEWADATFGAEEGRELAKAKHLRKEAGELVEAGGDDPEELADVVILAAHIAAGRGISLAAAIRAKLEVLRRREWGEADEDGVVEHVRGVDRVDGAGRRRTVPVYP